MKAEYNFRTGSSLPERRPFKRIEDETVLCPECGSDNVALGVHLPYTTVIGNCFACAWSGHTELQVDDYVVGTHKPAPRGLNG